MRTAFLSFAFILALIPASAPAAGPPPASPAAQRVALQAAMDGANPGDTLDLGGQSVTVDRPLFVPDKISLSHGEIHVPFGRHHAALYLGIPRAPLGQRLDPAKHWFDLSGGRHGLRTSGDAWLATSSLPLTYGMERQHQLTVEWSEDYALTPPDGKGRGILGCQDHSRAYPLYILMTEAGTYQVVFRLASGAQHAFQFPAPAGSTPHDFAVQIDLPTATVAVWLDRVQVPVAWWYHEAPFDPDDCLADNDQIPFKLAAPSGQGNSGDSDYADAKGRDIAYRGLRASNAARYRVGRPGDPQARLDGHPLTDANTYFEVDGPTLGLLPLTDDPADAATDRHVTILSPQGVGMGLYLQAAHADTYSSIGGNTLENLTVQIDGGWMTPYGTAVVLGYELEFTARRCRFYGGAVGLGSWRWGASYVSRLYECRFQGTMASVYNYYEMMELYNCVIEANGRHTLWVDMGNLRVRDLFASYVGSNFLRSFARGDRGALVEIDHLDIDIEDGNCDPEFSAVFDFTTGGANPDKGFVRLKNTNFGRMPAGKPYIRLRSGDGVNGLGVFVLEDAIQLFNDDCSALIETDGGWSGMDSACSLRSQPYPRILDTSGPGQGRAKGRGVIRSVP